MIYDGGKMTNAAGLANSVPADTPESLMALIKYLELSLDQGKSVVMMRDATKAFSVSLGVPEDEENDLKNYGTLEAPMVEEILELTRPGVNRITVGDQTYRFFRSFTHIAEVGAVVFAPA